MQALLDVLLQLAAAGLMAFGGYAIQRLAAWLKLREDSEVRAYLNQALERGLDLALAEARVTLAPHLPKLAGPALDNVVATTASYAQNHVAGALKHFSVGDPALTSLVKARIAARYVGLSNAILTAG